MPKNPASPTTINPPEGWKDGEGFGFLYGRDAQGQPVDLVRLSDLVPWLQQRDKLSFSDAVRTVMDAVPGDVMQWLFRMEPGNAATVVPASALFGFRGLAELAKARGMSVATLQANLAQRNRDCDAAELAKLQMPARVVMKVADANLQRYVRLQYVWPQEPGRPALLRYLGKVQASQPAVLNDKRAVIAFLAIPRAMANALFGWGTVASESAVAVNDSKLAKALAYDWNDSKTVAALLRDYTAAPGNSQRAKCTHLSTTEKWGGVGFETLRKQVANALKNGGGEQLQGTKRAAGVWDAFKAPTQRKSGRAG